MFLPAEVRRSRLLSNQIEQYYPELKQLARRYTGRFGAESEDLVQEGAIFVWQSLEKGIVPAKEHIQNRMRNWVRTLEYQSRSYRQVSFEKLQEEALEREESSEENWDIRWNGLDHGPTELHVSGS